MEKIVNDDRTAYFRLFPTVQPELFRVLIATNNIMETIGKEARKSLVKDLS